VVVTKVNAVAMMVHVPDKVIAAISTNEFSVHNISPKGFDGRCASINKNVDRERNCQQSPHGHDSPPKSRIIIAIPHIYQFLSLEYLGMADATIGS
jgi:hypothetical protein